MEEGILKLKQNAGGNRHYIELPDGRHVELRCGARVEVQLGAYQKDESFVPGRWVAGRYEADLCGDSIVAYLYIGRFYPLVGDLVCELPMGVRVREVPA